MKRYFERIFLTTVMITTFSVIVVADEKFIKGGINGDATITVTLSGIKDIKGIVSAGLYNDEEDYKNSNNVRGVMVNVDAKSITFNYDNLPKGEYAIKLFHDVDSDGKLDTNLFGIPKEPYAFSNNATGRMGAAKWKDAKFSVDGKTIHSIKLN